MDQPMYAQLKAKMAGKKKEVDDDSGKVKKIDFKELIIEMEEVLRQLEKEKYELLADLDHL